MQCVLKVEQLICYPLRHHLYLISNGVLNDSPISENYKVKGVAGQTQGLSTGRPSLWTLRVLYLFIIKKKKKNVCLFLGGFSLSLQGQHTKKTGRSG